MKNFCNLENDKNVFFHSFYLEGLCRLRKLNIVQQIIYPFNSKHLHALSGPFATVELLKHFPQLAGPSSLVEAVACPCISDEEILSLNAALNFDPTVMKIIGRECILPAFKTNRVRLFKLFTDFYFESLVDASSDANLVKETINVLAVFSGIISKDGEEFTPQQTEMIKYYFSKLPSQDLSKVCQELKENKVINPEVTAVCTSMAGKPQSHFEAFKACFSGFHYRRN